jgi:hypothetical protein
MECAPGTAFNRDIGLCDIADRVNCDHVNPCNFAINGIGNAPSTQFCNDFFICFENEILTGPHTCASGLLFDKNSLRCTLPVDATCFPGSIRL